MAKARNRWATRLITAGGPDLPLYGSPEWQALDDNDPRKVASCVRAAEAWRVEATPERIRERLLLELDGLAAADEQAERERWDELTASFRAHAGCPTYAQLCDMRGEPRRAERARALARERGLPVR